MTRKKTDAKKPADAKPEEDQPVEQAGGATEATGAVVPGDGANAAEGGSEKPAGAPGAADGADDAPVGEAAPGPDGEAGAENAETAGGDIGGAQQSDDHGGESAGNGGDTHGDDIAGGESAEKPAANADLAQEQAGTARDVNAEPGDYWPAAFSTPLDDSNRMLAMVADEAARVASYGMVRVNISFDTFDPDATTQGPKMAGPDHLMLEVKALADKIGERATPEVCWTHVKLAGVLAGKEMMDWDRAYFMVFVSVYLELKKAADQHRAFARVMAPAPPKKKIDPEDLTTGMVEGFGATIKTR
ncbi:hypothetical protein [Martelella sp. FOR1707]